MKKPECSAGESKCLQSPAPARLSWNDHLVRPHCVIPISSFDFWIRHSSSQLRHVSCAPSTIDHQLGISSDRNFMDNGRPVPILYQGSPIAELI